MLSRGMRDKPIEISRGSLGSLRVAVPFHFLYPKVRGRGGYGYTLGTAQHGTLPEFLYQYHLEVSKLSGLSSQMEMLD